MSLHADTQLPHTFYEQRYACSVPSFGCLHTGLGLPVGQQVKTEIAVVVPGGTWIHWLGLLKLLCFKTRVKVLFILIFLSSCILSVWLGIIADGCMICKSR